jgi:hypothetical protein
MPEEFSFDDRDLEAVVDLVVDDLVGRSMRVIGYIAAERRSSSSAAPSTVFALPYRF